MRNDAAFWPTVLLTFSVTLLISSGQATAHAGGLNASGCHNSRKAGDYHCHRPQRTALQHLDPAEQGILGPPGGFFPNCSAARAAGAAPVRIGEPGYGPHLDRD